MSSQEKLDALKGRSVWEPEDEVGKKLSSDAALLESLLQFEDKWRKLFGARLQGVLLSLPKEALGNLLLRFQTDMTMLELETMVRPVDRSYLPRASSPLKIAFKAKDVELDTKIKGAWEAFVMRCEVQQAYELSLYLSRNPSFLDDLLRAEAEQRRVFKDHVVTMKIEPLFRTEDFETECPVVSVIAVTNLAGEDFYAALDRTDAFWVHKGVPNIMLQSVHRTD